MTEADQNHCARICGTLAVKGEVRGDDDLVVEGEIEGALAVGGALRVEVGGVVKARVTARRAVIGGTVVGDVDAAESIQILEGARVLGTLRAPKVSIAKGARFSGMVETEAPLFEAVEPGRAIALDAVRPPMRGAASLPRRASWGARIESTAREGRGPRPVPASDAALAPRRPEGAEAIPSADDLLDAPTSEFAETMLTSVDEVEAQLLRFGDETLRLHETSPRKRLMVRRKT